MGRLREMPPVKALCGVLTSRDDLLPEVRRRMEDHLGPVSIERGPWPFDNTDYYTPEMGPHLKRWFWAFARTMDAADLPELKLFTQALEGHFAGAADRPDRRVVNLDPGYLESGKLVLASTKNHAHRVYIGKGIFAEVTLHYRRDTGWTATPWTFPDFASGRYDAFLDEARGEYMQRINE